jgi:uncharacterized membrane protein YfcA
MAGTYAGAWLSGYVSGAVQLAVFAVVMLAAAVMMFRQSERGTPAASRRPIATVVADGLAVGALTGFVGVGGGFLILPALVLLGGLGMHVAIGTSLAIIALNAFTGFAKHLHLLSVEGLTLDWKLLGTIALIGALGSVAGSQFGSRLPQATLRRAFGVFLVAMALLILYESGPRALGQG